MKKFAMINELMITYDMWKCGYTRSDFEQLTQKELKKILDIQRETQ